MRSDFPVGAPQLQRSNEDSNPMSNLLARNPSVGIFRLPFGAVAQLGERRTGSAEVRGSIPLGSTNYLFFLLSVRHSHEQGAL
jgi:hypothetical protein